MSKKLIKKKIFIYYKNIEQKNTFLFQVQESNKMAKLIELLREHNPSKAMVFVGVPSDAVYVANSLSHNHFRAMRF